jgi:transcriptional regulator GlxA family with amidase domain
MRYMGKQNDIAFPNKLVHDSQLFRQFKGYLEQLQTTDLKDHVTLQKCLEQLIGQHSKAVAFEPFEMKIPYLEEVLMYMSQNCHTKIKLDDLAKMTPLSKYQFIRQFKKNVGLTPFEYINLERTKLAKKLLREGASFIDTALASGYYDQSHFNNYFKNYIGLSPGDYVKSQYVTRHLPKKPLGL